MTTSDAGAAARIEPLTAPSAEWLALRRALWPECPDGEHRAQMAAFAAAPARYAQFMVYTAARTPAAFAEAAIGHDPVNGTSSSPVAVLEWARRSGCTELASDALLDNEVSHAMHWALGFEETERVVCLRKSRS